MPIVKIMKGLPSDSLSAEGLMYHDLSLTPCQHDCFTRLGMTMQIEQEAYLTNHPEGTYLDHEVRSTYNLASILESYCKGQKVCKKSLYIGNILIMLDRVKAMVELFISKMAQTSKRKDVLKAAGEFFTKPAEELDKDIRERLGVPENGPYIMTDKSPFVYEDSELINDLRNIISKYYPPAPWTVPTPYLSMPNTPSSSFISLITSDTTLPTPEPIPTPEPTLSETFFNVVSNTVDKAIFSHVDDRMLRYDTAYVELTKCVEEAMEIPVTEIKEDIAELFYNSFKMFELTILEKERIAAEIAWEKRMRKKLKRTLRRLHNFKGYETPPSSKSEISSHESYKKPPLRPCICHPQYHYNRYPKDRFGIYLPIKSGFRDGNVTATPAISVENLVEAPVDDKADTKSVMSKKSVPSTKSNVSKKTTISQ